MDNTYLKSLDELEKWKIQTSFLTRTCNYFEKDLLDKFKDLKLLQKKAYLDLVVQHPQLSHIVT